MTALREDAINTERWHLVADFQLDDPEAKLCFSTALMQEMDWSGDFTHRCIMEYKKFAFLSSLFPNKIVPSIYVDTVWHMHLLYTKSYHRFSQDALGISYLHHEPANGNDGESEALKQMYANTLATYEEFFGAAPTDIWGGTTR